MECQSSDSKKLFEVFDATKRKRTRKKHEALDDTNSIATEDSTGGCRPNGRRVSSAKASLQNVLPAKDDGRDINTNKRDRDSSPSVSRSPEQRASRSPRRHRRIAREGISLALKAGLVSTPRSTSPLQDGDGAIESVPRDQDSFIYAFLEEAVKRDKKKHRHSRRCENRRSRDREASVTRDHHRHRRHREDTPYRERDKSKKEEPPRINQGALFETFAKLCAQMNEKTVQHVANPERVTRCQSHKSLQCEVISKGNSYDVNQRPVRLRSREQSKDYISPSRIRSHDDCRSKVRSRDHVAIPMDETIRETKEKCVYCAPYDKDRQRYTSRQSIVPKNDERYQGYYCLKNNPTRSYIDGCYKTCPNRDYREYDDRAERRQYDERKKVFEQKASRSFDVRRETYEDDRNCRRTARSDGIKDGHFEYRDKRYEDRCNREKYYDEKAQRDRNYGNLPRDRRIKRNLEHFERASIASREDDYREKDKYSERERDSGLSVADGETSTMSGRSNCLRVVKQEISEQREAMDKMMKLWKELMRCFKGISQTQGRDKDVNESAANVRESAAAQLRLWRECMRRYETVARDVGDTDARLMEEINKQRSEMAEMATMWQECLQRYRDMSNDFNSLKQQLVTPESPTRLPAPTLVCAEGEGVPAVAPYRIPSAYPPQVTGGASAAFVAGTPLRAHASAPPGPPPWWWAERAPSPRRRSSPDSRASRDRRRRRKDRERDDSRYKEKTKTGGARSDHKHRKR